METAPSSLPLFSHVEPVLAVKDVRETIEYWHDVLGFPNKWYWDDPPTFGAISWQSVHVQFFQHLQQAERCKGASLWVRMERLDSLFELHKRNNADILSEPKIQAWGMRDYTVRDINDYRITFSEPASNRPSSKSTFPKNIQIGQRKPTPVEYRRLVAAVNWTAYVNDAKVPEVLEAARWGVVAIDTDKNEVVASALLLSDDVSFYYIKDVMVHPDWQNKKIGTALMESMNRWIDDNGSPNALVGLLTGENLDKFYRQFGFDKMYGMHRRVPFLTGKR
ncbi:MAG TPA: GNAT family N-acetyltransferase [Cyclobacteriaceae bacterium]|nr:GNAT family N-acetyltransferase [Cyclobacteriaceae bacterium]